MELDAFDVFVIYYFLYFTKCLNNQNAIGSIFGLLASLVSCFNDFFTSTKMSAKMSFEILLYTTMECKHYTNSNNRRLKSRASERYFNSLIKCSVMIKVISQCVSLILITTKPITRILHLRSYYLTKTIRICHINICVLVLI